VLLSAGHTSMNDEQADRAREMAEQFLTQREFERAIRLLERSQALRPSARTIELCTGIVAADW
jgi:hypothetical protein